MDSWLSFFCWFNFNFPQIFLFSENRKQTKDLSQNPDKKVKRARTSTSNGSLPTFTTSSSCLSLTLLLVFIVSLVCEAFKFSQRSAITHVLRWSKKHGRPLTGTEMLSAMGLPVMPQIAKSIGLDQPDVSMLKSNAKASNEFFSLEVC